MKKTISILAALMLLNTVSTFAQTEATAKCGETVAITATPDAGYKFLYWDDDHSLTSATREVTLTDSTSLYDYVAVFGIATYTVYASTDQTDMGTVSGGGDYEFGASVELEATPKSKCYKFVKWSDGITTAKRTITVGATAADNTYTAVFAEEEFSVKVSSLTGGSVVIIKK